jgi:hypothetical protein
VSVGAGAFSKRKRVTDFSVTPWHASWWSWRESNPRPLECYASNTLKLLSFLKKIAKEPHSLCWLLPTVTSRSVAHQPTYRQQAGKASVARLPKKMLFSSFLT